MAINYDALAEQARQNAAPPKPVNPLTTAAAVGATGVAGLGAVKLAQKAGPAVLDLAGHLPVIGPAAKAGAAMMRIGKALAPNQPAPPAQPAPADLSTAAPPVEVKISQSDPIVLTKADIKGPFKGFKEGHIVSRGTYERTIMKAQQSGSAAKRVVTKPAAEPPSGGNTDMRVGTTAAGNKQQGRFGARTVAEPGTAPYRVGNVIVGPGAGTPEEAQAAREAFLAERQAARAGSVASRVNEAALPVMTVLPAAVAIARHLMSGGSIQDLGDPENVRRLMETIVPTPPQPQYGEPGYTGPI